MPICSLQSELLSIGKSSLKTRFALVAVLLLAVFCVLWHGKWEGT